MKADIYLAPDTDLTLDGGHENTLTCLVLVDSDGHGSEEDMVLDKLLGAIKLDRGSSCLVYIGSMDHVDVNACINKYGIENILVFGYSPMSLPFNANLRKYHINRLGKLSIIYSDSIQMLNADGAKKKQLWQLLQAQFLK